MLMRFSGASFKSSNTDFGSIWGFIYVTQAIAAPGGWCCKSQRWVNFTEGKSSWCAVVTTDGAV